MNLEELLSVYSSDERVKNIQSELNTIGSKVFLKGLIGSSKAIVASSVFKESKSNHLFILDNKEEAAYFLNDLQAANPKNNKIYFFPESHKKLYQEENIDNAAVQYRAEVLESIKRHSGNIIVSYPEAVSEAVVTKKHLAKNSFDLSVGEEHDLELLNEQMIEFDFEPVDYAYEPGQFSIRGGIVDIFSYSNEYPFRIEFFGDEIDSIRLFDPVSQLSVKKMNRASIVPNVQEKLIQEQRETFFDFIGEQSIIWTSNYEGGVVKVDKLFYKATEVYSQLNENIKHLPPKELFLTKEQLEQYFKDYSIIEFGIENHFKSGLQVKYSTKPQPSFNKNFDLLIEDLKDKEQKHYKNLFVVSQEKQIERLYAIFEDLGANLDFKPLVLPFHEGFIDEDKKIACYTDHQIFERYHRFRLKDGFRKSKQALTLKEVYNLQKGDYVVHIDHGVGKFSGLEKIDNHGKIQESIRLEYKGGDVLYVNIHSLHRISKYVGKDGTPPSVNKIGSPQWNKLKDKTKSKIKKLAFDLIQLYAKRKARKGFAYTPDSYLQNELEASFIYEDTPDQYKATQAVKEDMEKDAPMDRLVCGDVGFGKTEVAIRAAFKAATDGKQVAVLVPTTILSLQHYKNFKERLKGFPVTVDYVNRFKSTKQNSETLKKLVDGKIDILVGTHKIVGKSVKFKDLGLVIIDEEQKFGVNVKDKLKAVKDNVDILTLTATPIPRTLQFSLMGARDLSIINTPPPNRQPIETELIQFNEEQISEAIAYELDRGGQVYFVHNKVKNINEIADLIRRMLPGVSIGIGHGQMDGAELEQIMMDYINGDYDVLLATTIIESGIDIPNANTIIINEAQNFGLSDLHQLRGRVGRSNKKAFCYLITPKLSGLPSDSRKRLETLAQFSDLGSGFNIAMRDLDIRGAGNLLGGEQSGFISDIGIEMYQKILNETLQELRENEFKELFEQQGEEHEYVTDCQLETDYELMIPDSYINNVSERLALYQEIDKAETDTELEAIAKNLTDRFGPLPEQVEALLESVQLRWVAKEIGFEKLIIKSKKMIGYFIANQESPYFQSPYFTRVLSFIQSNPTGVKMNEKNNKLRLVFENVLNVDVAKKKLEQVLK